MLEMAMKPPLWIHACKHVTAASEEEHTVNDDRAKRAFTANTLFTPLTMALSETTATCENGMVPEHDPPEQMPMETRRTL